MKIRLGSLEFGVFSYLLLWLPVVLAFAMQGFLYDTLLGQEVWSLFDYLRWSMIQWYTWAALAPLVFRFASRHPIRLPLRPANLAMHVFAGIGVTSLALVMGAVISTLFEPGDFGQQMRQFFGRHAATGLLAYWALLLLQHALNLQAEKSRQEIQAGKLATELAQSRLQVLKTQLQPHFLFNTLHAILTLLDDDKPAAEDMLLRLSELLRVLLEDYGDQEISLRRELELLDLYLGIQRKRFKDRLSTQVYVAPDTLDCAVPTLILQPLVENAIDHGIGKRAGDDRVEIESRREGDALRIEVRNYNSTLAGENPSGGHGIGLSNTRLRLRELYGERADIRLDMIWPQGVACRILLPLRQLEESDDMPEHLPA